MKLNLGLRLVAGSLATLTLTIAGPMAHAAPPVETAAPRATGVPQTPVAALVGVRAIEVEVLPLPSKCGFWHQTSLKVTNKSGAPWNGVANLVVEGVAQIFPPMGISLLKDEVKVHTLGNGKPFDCKKPISNITVNLFHNNNETTPIFSKQLHPTMIMMFENFSHPPPPNGGGGGPSTKVWLRRVDVTASCGGPVTPAATFMLDTGPAQQASVKLTWAGAPPITSDVSVLVNPGIATQAKLPVTQLLNCQSATGIPTLTYGFAGATQPTPPVGTISATEVIFVP